MNTVIENLEKQHKLDFIPQIQEESSLKKWWSNLSFVWQQIFRSHLNLEYNPTEIDLLMAVHGIIDHCQDSRLREKTAKFITDKKFSQHIRKWYNALGAEQRLFNSYLPRELSEQEIQEILQVKIINCSNNIAVVDLKPLERLRELEELNCMNTYISDLSPLTNLSKIEQIYLNFTKIEDLLPLENLKNLKYIKCYGTDLKLDEIQRFKNQMPKCQIEEETFLVSYPSTLTKKSKK